MADLNTIKDNTLNNMVAQLKTWAIEGSDDDIKAFLSQIANLKVLNKEQIKKKFDSFMEEDDKKGGAWDQLQDALYRSERNLEDVRYVVFGEPHNIVDPSIDEEMRGIIFGPREASSLMEGWDVVNENPQAPTYNVMIWTSHRILWTKIASNGSVSLKWVPIKATAILPVIP